MALCRMARVNKPNKEEALGRILFSSVVMVLAYQPGGPGSNPARILYFCHALFISFFITDFVRKMGARLGLAVEPLIPFIVQKMDFLPNRLSVINK